MMESSTSPPAAESLFPNGAPDLKGKNFLFALLCGGFGVIFTAILFKRIVHRFSFRYMLRAHTPGHRAPQKLKKRLQNQLAEVVQFCYEPDWLIGDNDKRNLKLQTPGEKDKPENRHLYRLKTIDGFRKIDQCLASINPKLSRPCDRPMLQHLLAVKSHSSGCFNLLHRSDLETLSNIYEHARYSPKDFGPSEYRHFCEILDQVLVMLQNPNEIRKRKSLYKTHRRSLQQATTHLAQTDDFEMISLINPGGGESIPDCDASTCKAESII